MLIIGIGVPSYAYDTHHLLFRNFIFGSSYRGTTEVHAEYGSQTRTCEVHGRLLPPSSPMPMCVHRYGMCMCHCVQTSSGILMCRFNTSLPIDLVCTGVKNALKAVDTHTPTAKSHQSSWPSSSNMLYVCVCCACMCAPPPPSHASFFFNESKREVEEERKAWPSCARWIYHSCKESLGYEANTTDAGCHDLCVMP